jgi:hypothetical protein
MGETLRYLTRCAVGLRAASTLSERVVNVAKGLKPAGGGNRQKRSPTAGRRVKALYLGCWRQVREPSGFE